MPAQIINFLTEPLLLGLIWSVLALGVFIAYRVLDIADLSVEGVLPLTAAFGIWIINQGCNPVIAIFLTIILGALCGIITASLHVFLKIPTLLSGIIMMTGLLTFILIINPGNINIADGKATIFTYLNAVFSSAMGNLIGTWLSEFIIVGIIVAICVILLYLFFGSNLGISIRATGKNKTMSKACGINVSLMIIIGLAISSGLVGLAGGLLGQHQGYVSTTSGKGTIVIGLATLFLGEVALGKKSFKINLLSIIIGAFIYWYIIDAIQLIPNFDSKYLYLVQAMIMILVMAVPYLVRLIQDEYKRRKAGGTCARID
jgi:putative ABC transport system permease protein